MPDILDWILACLNNQIKELLFCAFDFDGGSLYFIDQAQKLQKIHDLFKHGLNNKYYCNDVYRKLVRFIRNAENLNTKLKLFKFSLVLFNLKRILYHYNTYVKNIPTR